MADAMFSWLRIMKTAMPMMSTSAAVAAIVPVAVLASVLDTRPATAAAMATASTDAL
jgi:hypothetical protein